MWKIVLLLIVVGVWFTTIEGYHNICENKTITQSSIFLTRTDKHSSTNCWCVIISETGDATRVIFNVTSFAGRQYKLSVSNGTRNSYFENKMSPDIFFTISGSVEINVQIEENNCSVNDGLEFGIEIYSNPGNINLTCQNPTDSTSELCTQITSTIATTNTIAITSTVSTTRTGAATNKETATSKLTATPPVTSPTTSFTKRESFPPEITREDDTPKNEIKDELVAGLIGGLVSCIIMVIVLIVLIICIVRRQHQKEDLYSQPSTIRTPPWIY